MSFNLKTLPYDPSRVLLHPLLELTQSSMKTFQACPQKYVFRYLLHLNSPLPNTALITGTAIHKGLEVLFQVPQEELTQKELSQALQVVEKVFDDVLDNPMNAPYTSDLRQGQAQAYALVSTWPECNADRNWVVIHPEKIFRNTATSFNDSILERMAGKTDGIVLFLDNQEKGGLEHKSKRTLTGFNWSEDLDVDLQLVWYFLLAQQEEPDMQPRIAYNVLGKPQHRLNAAGWEELVQRMKIAIGTAPEKYFTCPEIILKQEVIDRTLINIRDIACKMDHLGCGGAHRVTQSTERCSDYGACPYKRLCASGADANHPEDVVNMPEAQLFILTKPHEELDI